jgi:hypothetical protein
LGTVKPAGRLAPVRHPAKFRRIKTALQQIIYRAAKVVEHARRVVLDFSRNGEAHVRIFTALHERLRQVVARDE